MERKQHHTSARPRWGLNDFDARFEIEWRFSEVWRAVETLWRILLHWARPERWCS
jgi:hypothetical protein